MPSSLIIIETVQRRKAKTKAASRAGEVQIQNRLIMSSTV